MIVLSMRNDPEIRGTLSPFLQRLINRVGILAHNIATHMQSISHNMIYVGRLRTLQLLSRQRYIV